MARIDSWWRQHISFHHTHTTAAPFTITPQTRILLVEDDQIDTLAFRRAMRDLSLTNPLLTAGNGEDALRLLYEHEDSLPDIIFMDMNMPRMNGLELLTRLKKHPALRSIPVIVLTTSGQPHEREQCFALAAAAYIVKPLDYNTFVEVLRAVFVHGHLDGFVGE